MAIDAHRLLVLRAVHRAGGVLPASRALFLTPSAVSQHLTRLEDETGLALVDRTRRGGGRALELTAAGRALAEEGDRLAGLLAEVDETVSGLRGERSGPVRVGGFSTVLRKLIAPAIVDLSISEPGIVPTVVEVDDAEGLALVRGGELDLAVLDRLPDARPPRGVEVVDLMRDPYRIVVPASWPVTDDAATLLAGAWIGGRAGSAAAVALDELGRAHDVTLDVRHRCDQFSSTLALVGAGLGASVVADLVLGFLPMPGVRVSTGALDPGARMLYVAHRRGRAEPGPAATALLDALWEHAA